MSLLSELKSKKLGLIELISMGFHVYLENLKPILLVFCTMKLPSMIVGLGWLLTFQNPSDSTLRSILVIVLPYVSLLFLCFYEIATGIITDNYVHRRNTNYQSIVKKISTNINHLFSLTFRFGYISFIRYLLLLIPGIIYIINNQYYGLAFILRGQRGKAAFAYSRSVVKGNWWKVFFFGFLTIFVAIILETIFSKILNTIPFVNTFWVYLLSTPLSGFIVIGIEVGNILLFLNLEFQKNLEN